MKKKVKNIIHHYELQIKALKDLTDCELMKEGMYNHALVTRLCAERGTLENVVIELKAIL